MKQYLAIQHFNGRGAGVLIMLGLALLLVLPTPAAAQDDDIDWCAPTVSPRLIDGDRMTGSIDDTVYVYTYCFEGRAGDLAEVTVTTTSGDLDPLIGVFDETFVTLLAENDNISATDTNSRITYRLPENGLFLIAVTRFDLENGTTSGDFALTMSIFAQDAPAPTAPPADTNGDSLNICESPSARTIAIGATETATIDDEQFVVGFCIDLSAGQVLRVETEATSGDLDTKLIISDPLFEQVFAENDDIALGDSNAALTFTVPADGEYVIAVTRFEEREGRTTGDFALRLLDAETSATTDAAGLGGFGVPLRAYVPTAPDTDTGPTTARNLCGDTVIAELTAAAWEPLQGLGGVFEFNCDGTVIYTGGASADRGTFALEGDVLTISLEGRTIVWDDFLLVAGLITAQDSTNTEIYYVPVSGN